MKQEIEKLQHDLDALKAKYQDSLKPSINKGWVKLKGYEVFCYTDDLRSGYGISHDYTWTNQMFIDDLTYWEQATTTEVQQALEKEAVKRGFKEGVRFKTKLGGIYTCKGLIDIWERADVFGLQFTNSEGLIFSNGTWAEIVKEMSTIDYCKEFYETSSINIANRNELIAYLKNNNLQITEIK